ncbi:MAG: hypothetical protein J6B87_07090 [Clostridia bacterium]|nr:hypothetical protein [Clostridia bacterium]
MTEKEKQKALVKYCLKYKRGGRINNAVKTIGWSLNHCNGSKEDAKFASFLLNLLIGDEEDAK